ncbi:MAG: carbohydrate kinase family protein, partial [Promethearchaeota archaeon]
IFPEDSTAHSVILINSKYKDRSILAYKGANDLFSPEHIDKYMLKSTRCFAWTSLTSDKAIQAIQDCINIAVEHGAIIAGAPSISILKKRREDAIHLLKQCDVTSMNDEELEEITNKHDVIMGMKQLFEWGLKIVNITLGKEGAMVSDGKILIKTTPPSIHVMDTTGAGDATMSGLIYGILKNLSLYETAQIATSMSAMEIEQEGCRVGLPEKFSALEDFMHSHEFMQETSNFPKFTKE